MPLTADNWWGFMLRAIRHGEAFDAASIGWVGIFPCAGGRDEEAAERLARTLQEARIAAGDRAARSARCTAASRGRTTPKVWYHAPGFWLERAPPAGTRSCRSERIRDWTAAARIACADGVCHTVTPGRAQPASSFAVPRGATLHDLDAVGRALHHGSRSRRAGAPPRGAANP